LYNCCNEILFKIGVKRGIQIVNGAVFTFSAEAGLVCRMEVDKRKAKFSNEYEETMHYSDGSGR